MSETHFQPLDEKDLLALSEDPMEGLFQLIELLQRKYGKGNGTYSTYDERIVFDYLGAYIAAKPESVPKGMIPPKTLPSMGAFKNELRQHVQEKKVEERVMLVREHAKSAFSKQISSRQIRLDEGYKEQIRGYIHQIRKILDDTDLPPSRKQEIITRLNQLSEEIEKEYTRLDRLGELWLSATRSIGEGAKNLEPAVRLIERLRKVFSAAQEEGEQRLLSDGTARTELLPPADTEAGVR